MAAVAFKALLNFVGSDGHPFSYFCTVSDVNGAYYIHTDGQGEVKLPTNHGGIVYLKDVILSAAGTDTTTGTIFINAKNTGEYLVNASNLGTNLSRQFQQTPMAIAAGASLRILQNT